MALHVAIYTDDPDRGGVAIYNHQIALDLRAAGYRVTLIQSASTSPATRAQAAAGVAHEWISYDTGADFPRTMADSSDAYRIFGRIRPDLVIFSDGCSLSNLAAKHIAVHRRLPFIVVIHFAAAYQAERFARQLPVVRGHYAQASAVVAVSAETLAASRRYFGLDADRGRVIVNGVRPAFFAPRDAIRAAALRRRYGIAEDAVVSLTVARLTEVKGHVLQLHALEQLHAAPLVCVCAGGGELHGKLRAELAARGLEGRVILVGQQDDVAPWLDAAELFTLTSFVEGMPLSLLEAMAKGLPVVATAISGVPELLGATGVLLPDPQTHTADTVAQLAATWAAWLGDPARRRQLGDAGRERARAQFREDTMVAQLRAVVDEVASITRPA